MGDALDQLERSILSNDTQTDNHQESIVERHPLAYQSFIALLAIIAYIFIFSLPVISLSLLTIIPRQIITASDYISVSFIFIEVAIILIAGSLSLTLYQLKIPLPSGRPLNEAEAPKLYALLNQLYTEYSLHKFKPKIHLIKVTQHYEIKTIRTPRNGFPLFFTNTLLIGLPLMQSHSPKQLKILISREILHLSGARSRISSWLVFVSDFMQQYKVRLSKQVSTANLFLLAFFAWYTPLFRFMSQGIQKIETTYLDNRITHIYGIKNFSDTLIQSFIHKKYLSYSFWPHLNNKAYRHKTPPYLPYASLERNIRSKLDNETCQSWLDSAISNNEPSSADFDFLSRLEKQGNKYPALPTTQSASAALYFLEPTLGKIIIQMDKIWRVSNQFKWQQKYTRGQSELSELNELGIQVEQGLLSDERVWNYIQLIKRYKDELEAIDLYKNIMQLDTQDAHISFEIGRTLLEHLDKDGIGALEKAMQQEPGYTVMACQILTRYYTRTGDNRLAQSCRRRALAHQVNVA